MTRWVYFIKPIGMDGPIKIGTSASPDQRCVALDTWSPFALEIVAKIQGGRGTERRFHALLIAHHERREWFTASPEVLSVVEAVRKGTFDPSALPPPVSVTRIKEGHRPDQSRSQEAKLRQSLTMRVHHMERRTGYVCPFDHSLGDQRQVEGVRRYLADPHRYGTPIDSSWAIEARQRRSEASARKRVPA